jgi:hypothetical protein
MCIDSIILLIALIRIWCVIRKNEGVKTNASYMAIHFIIFITSVASLYFAYTSENTTPDSPYDDKVNTFKKLHMTMSVYMGCKFVMNVSFAYVIFSVAKRQLNAIIEDAQKYQNR